jgi:hypothetical protein
VPRTFQITSAQSVSQITTTDQTCAQVSGGTATTLGTSFYVVKSGKINKVTPNKLTYWLKLIVGAGTQHVEIDQAITSGNFGTKLALGSGSLAYTSGCAKVSGATFTSGGDGSVTASFTAPSAGTYYLAVRYLASSAVGQTVPSPTTVHYAFSAVGVAGSTSGFELAKQVTAAPAPAVWRNLRR